MSRSYRSNHPYLTRFLGHSSQFRKISFCVFGFALMFFASTITLYTFHTPTEQVEFRTPSSSIRTITGLITLTGISATEAGLDDTVTVSGNAQKWNGAAWDAYVGEIYLAVQTDDFYVPPTKYTSVTTTSDISGNFNLPFTVIAAFLGNNRIFANTSQGGYDTNCTNYYTLSVRSAADIEITSNIEPTLPGSTNYLVEGVVNEDITGDPYSGTGFNMEVWYGDQGTGVLFGSIAVGVDGTFSDYITHNSNYDHFTLYYAGGPEILGAQLRVDFYIITSIEVDFHSLPTVIYQNTTVSISGTVTDGQGYGLEGSEVTVEIVGVTGGLIFHDFLGLGGSFINANYTVPLSADGRYTIRVTVNQFYSNGLLETVTPADLLTDSQIIRIRPDSFLSNFPWEIVLIAVGAVGVIVGIFFLQRWLMKQRSEKDRKLLLKEIEERLENVRILYTMGRVKEALAYLYVSYTEIAQFKHGIEKEASQTTTEFAIVMVKQFGQNPQNIYPFIQEIEQVIYGGYPYNEQVFMHAVQLFGQIYLELMERPLPSFRLS